MIVLKTPAQRRALNSVCAAAPDEELMTMWRHILQIDETLMPGDTTPLQVKKKGLYMGFLKTHCNEHDYVFSVKKCGKDSCKFGCAEC